MSVDLRVERALWHDWRSAIDRTLADTIPEGPAALVNFPHHRNAGDAAIWLAERQALARLGRPVRYRCAWNGFSAHALRRRVGDGPILINGGGNFGDLYAGQQGLREHILRTCRDNPVVQLPQSIWFRDAANLERMRRLVGEHGNVTILCRDRRSEALARRAFDARVEYCPDMVLGLGPGARPAEPVVEILWLGREDPERRAGPPPVADDVEVCDWLGLLPGETEWPTGHRIDWLVAEHGLSLVRSSRLAASLLWRLPASRFDALAEGWIERARRILARGRVVVTDRLHAHVLALGMGIPSVVLDSSYGKVHDIARECTGASSLTHVAGDPAEALAIARRLVATGAGRAGAPGSPTRASQTTTTPVSDQAGAAPDDDSGATAAAVAGDGT